MSLFQMFFLHNSTTWFFHKCNVGYKGALRETCPNTDFSLVRISCIRTLFTQCGYYRENCDIPRPKLCPYSELFWSAYSRIRTEYGEIQNIEVFRRIGSIQSECGKIRTRITPNTDTFHVAQHTWSEA